MNDKQYDLSRRKLLAGLGTAGVAAAGAGLGTTAYLNDTESFDDNVITAGTLDLLVDYYSYWDQGMAGVGSVAGTADGEAVSATLSDVKPGDNGLIAFCPRIETNPAYLWLCGELTANDENGLTEPEAAVDDSGGDPGPWNGELAQNVEVTLQYCELAGDIGEAFDPEDVTDVVAPVWTGTLADFLATSEFGLPLDGGVSTDGDGVDEPIGFPVPGEQGCFAGTGDEATNYCLCLDWEVPAEVGNQIQSDSLTFDLQFFAEQCRHNDGTHNPCCTEASLDLSTGTGAWEVSAVPEGAPSASTPVVVTDPIDAWVDAPAGVSWINPYDADTNDSDPTGTYEYTAAFELPEETGDCTLDIAGFSADNPVEFFLDGDPIGEYDQNDTFQDLRGPISVSLAGGTHTLTAAVNNASGDGGNPTGLLADVSVTCDCSLPLS